MVWRDGAIKFPSRNCPPSPYIRRWRKMKQKMGEVKRAFYGEKKEKKKPQKIGSISPPLSPQSTVRPKIVALALSPLSS